MFTGLRDIADSSHLGLQGNVIVQPLEGIQQCLTGVWNFAWAENRDSAICVKQIERKPEVEPRHRQQHCWQNNRRASVGVGVLLQGTDEDKIRNQEVQCEMLKCKSQETGQQFAPF